jgi:hypothetical protein
MNIFAIARLPPLHQYSCGIPNAFAYGANMLLSERLLIVIVVSADMLRLENLRNDMRDVSAAAARHQRRARAARGGCSM